VKALIDLAKKKPNSVSYAVSGTGGINHFAGGLFSSMAGIQYWTSRIAAARRRSPI
jgi:tripartite-type tricarboxylate transporter receptor subunit TctC